MKVYQTILERRSIRVYKDTPVEKDVLQLLLKAAMAAPSAHNNQPWEFIAITDEAQMQWLRSMHRYSNYNAPAAILVCGNAKRFCEGEDADFWVHDAAAAMENILLVAQEQGLNSVWLGIHPSKARISTVQKHFNMPEHIIPFGVAYLGYGDQARQPRTQYNEDFVHWDEYSEK